MTGLYDDQGVLRFAGRDSDDCLAYAELFALDRATYSLEPLSPGLDSGGLSRVPISPLG